RRCVAQRLTHEYLRAVETYRLGYDDLRTLARNSLEYAFLPGASLWSSTTPLVVAAPCAGITLGATDPPSPCREHLATSEKARLQWRLEGEFAAFEHDAGGPDATAGAPGTL